jgi:hypothetical protein
MIAFDFNDKEPSLDFDFGDGTDPPPTAPDTILHGDHVIIEIRLGALPIPRVLCGATELWSMV